MGEGGEPAAERVDDATFKEVMGAVPAPVTVVTALHEGRPHGTTVSACCSLSLDPPLVIVSLDRDSELLRLVRETGRFGINLLGEGQEDHAHRFARKHPDKFGDLSWDAHRGLPRLPHTSAWLACRVEHLLDGGDHVIVAGLVEHAERSERPPLVYRERAFARLIAHTP
jgi:flavin reductase (DIM6/NTAB) family NADH-FMN oxidoreductase RutF